MKYLICFLIFGAINAGELTPVLLLAQHQNDTSSWSLCVAATGGKCEAIVLQELPGKNTKDGKYAEVLKYHEDMFSKRVLLEKLNVDKFDTHGMSFEGDKVTLNFVKCVEGYRLDIRARTSPDGHFNIGNMSNNHGQIYIVYKDGVWSCRGILKDKNNVVHDGTLKSIVFLAGTTKVSLILAVGANGEYSTLLDE